MKYNEIIKQKRTLSELTQQQLADKVGVSRQTVVRWENGWIVPSLYYAQKLSEIFGLSVTELMTGEAEKPAPISAPHTNYAAATARFCIVTFIPFILYLIFYYLINLADVAVRMAGTTAVYGVVISQAYSANVALCGLIFAVLLAFWIIRLVSVLRSAQDKYVVYREYKAWNVGLAFLLVNGIAWGGFILMSFISFIVPFLYVGALLIAAPMCFAFDLLMQRFCAARIVAPPNKKLGIINLAYTIVASVCTAAFCAGLIYAYVALYPTQYLTVAFFAGIYTAAAFIVEISYIIVRYVAGRRSAA